MFFAKNLAVARGEEKRDQDKRLQKSTKLSDKHKETTRPYDDSVDPSKPFKTQVLGSVRLLRSPLGLGTHIRSDTPRAVETPESSWPLHRPESEKLRHLFGTLPNQGGTAASSSSLGRWVGKLSAVATLRDPPAGDSPQCLSMSRNPRESPR